MQPSASKTEPQNRKNIELCIWRRHENRALSFHFSSFSRVNFVILFALSRCLLCLRGLLLASRCMFAACTEPRAPHPEFWGGSWLGSSVRSRETSRVQLPPRCSLPRDSLGAPCSSTAPRERGRINIPVFPLSTSPSAQGALPLSKLWN